MFQNLTDISKKNNEQLKVEKLSMSLSLVFVVKKYYCT